jgi:hypothetical protein
MGCWEIVQVRSDAMPSDPIHNNVNHTATSFDQNLFDKGIDLRPRWTQCPKTRRPSWRGSETLCDGD